MSSHAQALAGGLYGLLVGDALGVPYEFHSPGELPSYDEIEFAPPAGFHRAHAGVAPGTWSDDGAQALCLLDSLISCGKFDLEDYSDRLLSWYDHGLWAVDGRVFDVGLQTGTALNAYRQGRPAEACGFLRPNGKGNGALMRVLPLALWHRGDDRALVLDAHRQCLITHGHLCNQVCCALYCLTARRLAAGEKFQAAARQAADALRELYHDLPEHQRELEWSVRPDELWEGSGTGYVVDCLRSAFMVLARTESYAQAVKQAVLLGSDTDTTACVTGGLAGVLYGLQGIPQRWLDGLRGRAQAQALLVCAAAS